MSLENEWPWWRHAARHIGLAAAFLLVPATTVTAMNTEGVTAPAAVAVVLAGIASIHLALAFRDVTVARRAVRELEARDGQA